MHQYLQLQEHPISLRRQQHVEFLVLGKVVASDRLVVFMRCPPFFFQEAEVLFKCGKRHLISFLVQMSPAVFKGWISCLLFVSLYLWVQKKVPQIGVF